MNKIIEKTGLFLIGLAALFIVENSHAEHKWSCFAGFSSRGALWYYDIINPETGMTGAGYSAITMYNAIRIIEGKPTLKQEELFEVVTKKRILPNGEIEYVLKPDLFKGKKHYLDQADVNPKDNHLHPLEAKAFYDNIRGR